MGKATYTCRFCTFTTPKWSREKGQSKRGLDRLRQHIEQVHGSDQAKVRGIEIVNDTTTKVTPAKCA